MTNESIAPMSGSPKYSRPNLQAQIERQLAEDRRRRAAEEERIRKQKEEAERKRLIIAGQNRVQAKCNQLRGMLSAFSATSYGDYGRVEFQKLDVENETLIAQSDLTSSVSAITNIENQASQLENKINQAANRAQASERAAQHRAEAMIALEKLKGEVEGLRELFTKFNPSAIASLGTQFKGIEHQVQSSQLNDAKSALGHATEQVRIHREELEETYKKWQAERQKATTKQQRLNTTFDGLSEDEVTKAWVAQELKEIGSENSKIGLLMTSENWNEAAELADQLQNRLSSIKQQAQERQFIEEKRNYIISGLVTVLKSQDFTIEPLDLEHPGDLNSNVLIKAMRPDRRSLSLKIPPQGKISYEVDGYAKRVETGHDGSIAKTCDGAASRILSIHDQLKKEFGIDMSELVWDAKDPLRNETEKTDYPSNQENQQARGGLS